MGDNIQRFPILRSTYEGLTKSERRIAEYMADHPELLMDQTISDVAKSAQSSEITVSRFCRKLGTSGLQELKRRLMADLANAENEEFHDIHKDDSNVVIAEKIFKNVYDGLVDTLNMLDSRAFDAAADILMKAHQICVFGFGNSATVCTDIATRYERLGFIVRDIADPHKQATAAALLAPHDAVIAVSHSGATKELLMSVEAAKEAGASIVSITSHAQSPLAKLSDVILCGMGREVQYTSEAGASRLIHMAIGDVLYTKIAIQREKLFHENMEKMRRQIVKKKV